MRYGAKLGVIPKTRDIINVFGGVNKLPSCGENEFSEMSNMTCDCYPRAAAREPRLEAELTKTVTDHVDHVLTVDEGDWESYDGQLGVPQRAEEITDEDEEKTAFYDQREFIEGADGFMIENPGYGYKVETWGQDVTVTEYEYRNSFTERKATVKTVRRTMYERVVRADDPECLTFNGDHIFYLDRETQDNGYVSCKAVLDGRTVDHWESETATLMGKVQHTVATYGAYFIVWPECIYINSADPTDAGQGAYIADIDEEQTLYLSDAVGNAITPDYTSLIGGNSPEDEEQIEDGKTYLRLIGQDLKLFVMTAGEWVETDSFLSLRVERQAGKIAAGDVVYFTGRSDFATKMIQMDIDDDGRAKVKYVKDDDEGRIYVFGGIMPDQSFGLGDDEEPKYEVRIETDLELFVPRLDIVFESAGRLWGCRYGKQWAGLAAYMFDDGGNLIMMEPDGEFVNEIYCTGARSFTQWQRFTGAADGGPLDTDSVVFSVSEAGPFTGGCVYNGQPTFFKKDTMYRVSGSLSSGYSLYSDSVPGVQEGSAHGICIVNGVMYYKASSGVYAYAGGMPQRVSDKLGSAVMRSSVAGAYGHKAVFYLRELGEPRLYVYDTETGIWTQEVTEPVTAMTEIDDALVVQTTSGFYMMSQRGEKMREYDGLSINGTERLVPWSCTTGLMGLGNTEKKYVTRIEMRYLMPVRSMMLIDVEYDSSGKRIRVGQFQGSERLETRVASIRLRRCDHFRLYMQGVGACEIVTMTRTTEGGSDRNG